MTTRFATLGLAATMGAMLSGTALAGPLTLQMSLTSGTSSPDTFNIASGSGYTHTDWNGWKISALTASSHAPSAQPFGLNLNGLVSCLNASGCAPLTVAVSATGFTSLAAMAGFGTGLVDNNAMGPGEDTGTIVQMAYYDAGDTALSKANPIGAMTLEGFGSSYVSGDAAHLGTNAHYSLTLVDTFTDHCGHGNCAVFGIDGTIDRILGDSSGDASSSVPEPGTLALFGAGRRGCALFVRRRRAPLD